MRGTWKTESDPKPRLRHIAWTASTGDSFGDHYIRHDDSLKTADQFDIAVYPRGDNRESDWRRDTPHVVIRIFDGTEWYTVSVTPVTGNGVWLTGHDN